MQKDLVIATAVTTYIRYFSVAVCNDLLYQLEIGKVVVRVDPEYYRPTELDLLIGDPTKSKTQLGWKPQYDLAGLVKEMVASDLAIFKKLA